MSKTLTGSYAIVGYTLSGASLGEFNPVTVTGSIDLGTSTNPAALYAQGPGAWTVTNQGTITGNKAAGTELAAGGSILNAQFISGHFGVSMPTASGGVTNSGTILASNAGVVASANQAVGVRLGAGGSVNNQINGQIAGQGAGVEIIGGTGTVVNAGSISGPTYEGVYISGGNITNANGAVVTGGTVGSGGSIGAGGSVVNSGWGVVIRNGGSLVNAGIITGFGQGGALLGGGYVNNQGIISGSWGVAINGGAGSLVNSGSLVGTAQSGAFLTGGVVTNTANGRIVGVSGVVIHGAAGTVVNSGTIGATSPIGYGVYLGGGFSNRLIANPGASFFGSVNGGNRIGGAAVSSLELGVGAGPGTLSGIGGQFINFGQITLDAGAAWSVTGLNSLAAGATLSNLGSLSLDGAVLVNGSVASSGMVTIASPAGAVGSATITSGGSWSDNALLVIGDAGTGAFLVANSGSANAGAAVVGASAGGTGLLDVTGAGARLSTAGSLIIGGGGFGQLSISQAATVTADSADAAASAGGDGEITVTGIGSAMTIAGLLTIGDQSSGSMNIVNGASVRVGGLAIGTGATGSGNVVIGPGSLLTLTGTNINVGLAGSAVLDIQGGTLGLVSGTTLSPGTFGRIVQVGGLIDPATVFDASGGSFGGDGTAEASGTIVNSSLASVTGGAETLLAPLITSSDSINVAGVWSIKSGGTLVLDVNTFDNSQTIQFGDLTGVLTIGQQVTLDASQTPVPVAASALSGFAAPIVGYKAGNKITFNGLSVASDQVNGNVVTLFDSGHGTLGSLTFQTGKGGADSAGAAAAAAQIACFAEGTRIETADGPRAVETLAPGDSVMTNDGSAERIVWMGQWSVNCARHQKPEAVWPVCVQADAFGDGTPMRDLYLSPDHAVYVNEVLIPVKLLINGASIRQVKQGWVTYFHIELPRHEVILAEGLPVESYLDLGDRTNFHRGSETIRLLADFAARPSVDPAVPWETRAGAPLVVTGAILKAARAVIALHAPREDFNPTVASSG